MGKIIIPGQEEEKDIQALPDKEIILAMYEDAKEKGMDFREYLANQIDKWNPEDFIRETYESFLKAVQNGDEKPFPNENGRYWNEKSTFEEWLWYAKQTLAIRLEKLQQEKQQRPPSFSKLGQLRNELDDDQDQLKLVVEGAGEAPPLYILNFYEEVMRKSLEAINDFLAGRIKLPPKPSWGNIDNPEIAIEPEELDEEQFVALRKRVANG